MGTKQRGLKRKCRNMVRRIEDETMLFPSPEDCGYWHLHLPIARSLVDSRSVFGGVRRLCVRTLIRRAYYLANIAPDDEKTRVVAALSLPELSDSQIIVFFDRDYFAGFFNRNDDTETWELTGERLSKIWNVELPRDFTERVFVVKNKQDEGVRRGRIWFVGELNAH